MNKYETVFLLKDSLSEKERIDVLEKIKKYIKENGEIDEIQDVGIKKLAYEIRKCNQAYYYLIYFYVEPGKIAGLERLYRITEDIMKFIVIKQDN